MNKLIETKRLIIRFPRVEESDIQCILDLWNNPDVMKYVGFPKGLNYSYDDVEKILSKKHENEFERILMVELKSDGMLIGQCKLGSLNDNKIAHTDIKVLPKFWGNKYGQEIKHALLDYIFANTDAVGVEASPNKSNQASIKMQEASGAVRTGEGVAEFPEHMKEFTCTVYHYIYVVYRADWTKRS